MDNPDLFHVRRLLVSTEALFVEVATRMAEARRLQAEARALQGKNPGLTPHATLHQRPRRS